MYTAYNPKENDCQECVGINAVTWQLLRTGALVAPGREAFL